MNAHLLADVPGDDIWRYVVPACLLFAGLLVIQHHVVAGFGGAELKRRVRRFTGAAIIICLVAIAAPAGSAQAPDRLLPDLISDPPRPSFFNELASEDGQRLVVTFDGYVHNIGAGPLDVVGNPQEPGGMRQRVQTPDGWEEVGSPTVRFETDDGHNHFHLIEAVDYVLWNELQTEQTADGSKIGFCLVDSTQMEAGHDQSYTEDSNNFCQENTPQATELRMGISPGWRDVYDSTTTLQWVDVSNVAPGRYWIGAITDTNDEIVESNEDNNELVFSRTTIAVPGFVPLEQPPIAASDGVASVVLAATPHGTVGAPVFVVEEGPTNGTLDVPVGAASSAQELTYFADAGFSGTDQFTFSVRNSASPFPFERQSITVEITVDEPAPAPSETSTASNTAVLNAPSTFFETSVGEYSSVEIAVSDSLGGPARLHAVGLPLGLTADPVTGAISGAALEAGIFDVSLFATGSAPEQTASLDVTWIVNEADADAPGLRFVVDQSSPRGELTRLRMGANQLGTTFEAEGLPPGLNIDPIAPVVSGTPTSAGDYEVTVRQRDADGVIAEVTFDWTIRVSTDIEFVL